MITASKAATRTSQKASTTDQRHSCHSSLSKRKKKTKKCLQTQDRVKVCIIRFFTISSSDFLPSLKVRVQVCAHHAPDSQPSSVTDFLQIYNRRIIICQSSSVKLEKRLERTYQKQYQSERLKRLRAKTQKASDLSPTPSLSWLLSVSCPPSHTPPVLNPPLHIQARTHKQPKSYLVSWKMTFSCNQCLSECLSQCVTPCCQLAAGSR